MAAGSSPAPITNAAEMCLLLVPNFVPDVPWPSVLYTHTFVS